MRGAVFIAVEMLFLACAHELGGPWWTVLGGVACVAHLAGGLVPATLAPLFPALAWAAATRATGNREFFFPFAMHLAAATVVALPHPARAAAACAGLAVPGVFLFVRYLQHAPPRVLAVELLATVLVMGAVVGLRRWRSDRRSRWWIPVVSALLATACLAF